MKTAKGLLALLGVGIAESIVNAAQLQCTTDAFAKYLLSDSSRGEPAVVQWAYRIPKGGTFQVPGNDSAYPQSPTDLPELCVLQVNVTSSPDHHLLSVYSCHQTGTKNFCKSLFLRI
jgi:feruloyl esterase